MDKFALASPWYLLFLLALPLLSLLRGREGAPDSIVFSSVRQLKAIGARVRARPGRWHLAWLFLPLTLVVIALARPQLVSTFEETKESGVEMIVAVDISSSMDVDDFTIGGRLATRLQAAKAVTKGFIEGRPHDRIGIVAFAGRPYLASPLTLDHDWLMESLERLHSGLVTEQGTAIGSAVGASARRLDDSEAESKVVVLLTDGSNNSGLLKPRAAAELAKTLGIRVYTIAVGTPGVKNVPVSRGRVVRREEFDTQTLQDIADIANGKFFTAQDTTTLKRIFSNIDELEKTELQSRTIVEAEELHPWFTGAAALLGSLLIIGRDTFARRLP